MVMMAEKRVEKMELVEGFPYKDEGYLEISVFKEAVLGLRPYDASHPEIEQWEDFLMQWLCGAVYEDKEEYMLTVFHAFRDTFGYSGEIWRGMVIPHSEEIYPLPVASFSDSEEVAYAFAGSSQQYGCLNEEELEGESCYTLTLDVERALALDALMKQIRQLTSNQDLKNEIGVRSWEREKIYPVTAYSLESLCQL